MANNEEPATAWVGPKRTREDETSTVHQLRALASCLEEQASRLRDVATVVGDHPSAAINVEEVMPCIVALDGDRSVMDMLVEKGLASGPDDHWFDLLDVNPPDDYCDFG